MVCMVWCFGVCRRKNDAGCNGELVLDLSSVLGHQIIWVAVQPSFADLRRGDHWMFAGVRVLARVTVRRAVAAQRSSTFLAGTQMHPPVAGLYALLAYTAFGMFYRSDGSKMHAGFICHGLLRKYSVNERNRD